MIYVVIPRCYLDIPVGSPPVDYYSDVGPRKRAGPPLSHGPGAQRAPPQRGGSGRDRRPSAPRDEGALPPGRGASPQTPARYRDDSYDVELGPGGYGDSGGNRGHRSPMHQQAMHQPCDSRQRDSRQGRRAMGADDYGRGFGDYGGERGSSRHPADCPPANPGRFVPELQQPQYPMQAQYSQPPPRPLAPPPQPWPAAPLPHAALQQPPGPEAGELSWC